MAKWGLIKYPDDAYIITLHWRDNGGTWTLLETAFTSYFQRKVSWVIGRATIDLEPKIRTAEQNLILLPKMKKKIVFARLTSDHIFAYLFPGTICLSSVWFSTPLL